MDEQTARILLKSLLERLEADARREAPQFLSAVSNLERAALKLVLISGGEAPIAAVQSPEKEAVPPVAQDEFIRAEEVPQSACESAHDVLLSSAASITESADAADVQTPPTPDVGPAVVEPTFGSPLLDETALSFDAPQNPECVLCLDFGTARSKAFASMSDGDDDPDPELVELGLGRLDGDADAIYTVASSLWISDDGLLYVGSEAMRRSAHAVLSDGNRRRLDSVKQQLTLVAYEHNLAARRLEPELNPTTVPLSYEDAICLFLAYLTDLSVTELAAKGKSRYIKRRFTVPAWQPAQRSWAESTLAKYMTRAQILADTFHGKWRSGIPAERWMTAVSAAGAHDNRLSYLLDRASGARGILEPLAAGSGRVWADSGTKNLVLVIDVGAGTTDFSLFWVVQNIGNLQRKAFQVAPYSDAIRMAGDFIDERLLLQLVARAHGSSDELVRKRIETGLRLTGLRSLKERLFTTGEIQTTLDSTDQTVSIKLDEFLGNEQVKGVVSEIEKAVQRFLNSVDVSWAAVADNAQIVLTGGGANMPNIKALADRVWEFGGKPLRFRRVPAVPKFIADNYDDNFQREYPQLAVAIGGVLPVLDEKSRMEVYLGSSTPPGPLSGYHVTGT
jgi:molecular chaperone HscA